MIAAGVLQEVRDGGDRQDEHQVSRWTDDASACSRPFESCPLANAHTLRTAPRCISGSVEAACSLGLADGIVDLVETGTTMRAAGLEEVRRRCRPPRRAAAALHAAPLPPSTPRQPLHATAVPRRVTNATSPGGDGAQDAVRPGSQPAHAAHRAHRDCSPPHCRCAACPRTRFEDACSITGFCGSCIAFLHVRS